ncbi:MAG TPA: hypothetical protein VGC42_10210 [Kofleriaceae bacterium]
MATWARQFRDIPETLAARPELRAVVQTLLVAREIPVKVTEGGDRRARRKAILGALFDGRVTLDEAIAQTEQQLPREASPHHESNLVFAKGWARRLIHTHTSVLYCWGVLELLLLTGEPTCYVPHSTAEAPTSSCSKLLAGKHHDTRVMRDRLVQAYHEKKPMRVPVIPNHPHCTHVIAPVSEDLDR